MKTKFGRVISGFEYLEVCPVCKSRDFSFKFVDFEGAIFNTCKSCDLLFQNPVASVLYEDDYWGEAVDPDGNVRVHRNERDDKVVNQYADEIAYLNKLGGGNILDLGCGLGFFLGALNEKWKKFGFEISDYCKSYIEEHDQSINVINEFKDLDTFPKHFDAVYSYHVIEHVEDADAYLESVKRLLKDGGTFIISTPNSASLAAKIFRGRYRLLGMPHRMVFNIKNLKSLLESHKFEVLEVKKPFFKTRYFTLRNLLAMFKFWGMSPPFPGNIMTFYCRLHD